MSTSVLCGSVITLRTEFFFFLQTDEILQPPLWKLQFPGAAVRSITVYRNQEEGAKLKITSNLLDYWKIEKIMV